MKKIIGFIILFISIFSFCLQASATPDIGVIPEEYQLDLYKARVLEIKDIIVHSEEHIVQIAEIKILNRDYKDRIYEVRSTLTGNPVYDIELKKGSLLSVHAEERDNGEVSFYIISYERSNSIIQLLVIFLLCLFIIGRWKGIKAVIALSIIILLILYILIPLLLKGYNPILVSVVVCAVATIITLTITAGFNKKASAAIIGTIGSLIVGGLIAYIYGFIAKLTGFSSSDAQMLLYLPNQVDFDFKGLLFAGIIIGALGACMDVSISISSALTEMQKENPHMSFKKLAQSGFNIGRDIMGTMINTLILAYTGATLSTMLIFVGFQRTLTEIINLDSIATEIVRAITGSIGLLFSIPFTIIAFGLLSNNYSIFKRGDKNANN